MEPASASGIERLLTGMPEVWLSRRSVSFPPGTRVTFVTQRRSSSGTQTASGDARGTRCPRRQTDKSLPIVDGAQLGREKKATSG